MIQKDKYIKRFKHLCRNSDFAHRDEILDGLENGTYQLQTSNNSGVPSEQLLGIYKVREKHLAKYQSSHGRRIKDEVAAFCNELEKVPNENVILWRVLKDDISDFAIFSNSEKILGCILGIDKRKVSENGWRKIWDEN